MPTVNVVSEETLKAPASASGNPDTSSTVQSVGSSSPRQLVEQIPNQNANECNAFAENDIGDEYMSDFDEDQNLNDIVS